MSNIILRPWQKEDAQQLATIANNKSIWNNVKLLYLVFIITLVNLSWFLYKKDKESLQTHYEALPIDERVRSKYVRIETTKHRQPTKQHYI
jgi:hypothetical protein